MLVLVLWLLLNVELGACYQQIERTDGNELRSSASGRVKALLAPAGGAWWGVAADFNGDLDAYDAKLGAKPASYELFVELPLRETVRASSSAQLASVA